MDQPNPEVSQLEPDMSIVTRYNKPLSSQDGVPTAEPKGGDSSARSNITNEDSTTEGKKFDEHNEGDPILTGGENAVAEKRKKYLELVDQRSGLYTCQCLLQFNRTDNYMIHLKDGICGFGLRGGRA